MSIRAEIQELEERLRQAELGPDPAFFESALADDVVLVDERGKPSLAKSKVVEAHRPGGPTNFTRVEMRDLQLVEHGVAAVVTCEGTFEGSRGSATLRFMRVWLKKADGWQIVAASVSSAATA
jgi:ketosteroid isomerase-like protein